MKVADEIDDVMKSTSFYHYCVIEFITSIAKSLDAIFWVNPYY